MSAFGIGVKKGESHMGLLSEIKKAATTSAEPLPDLLRRCKVLAARLKNAEFAAWVARELTGYDESDDVPSYRVVATPHSKGDFAGPFGSGAKNVPLPLLNVDADIRRKLTEREFRQSIGALEEISRIENPRLPWPADLVALTCREFMAHITLMSAEIALPAGALVGILDTVRTRVLDFVLAIQAANPEAGDSPPNAAPPLPQSVVHNVFHNTIIGGHANIGITGTATIDNSDTTNTFTLAPEKDAELTDLISAARTEAETFPDAEKSTALATINQVAGAAKAKRMTAEGVKSWATALGAVATTATAVAPNVHALAHWLNSLF